MADCVLLGSESVPPETRERWPETLDPLLSSALDCPRAGSVVFDQSLHVQHATARLGTLLGVLPELVRGMDLVPFLGSGTELDRASLRIIESACLRAVETPHPSAGAGREGNPLLLSSVDGTREIALQIRRIGSHFWIASFEDVTIRRQAESRLLGLALTDPMTGLGNRTHFDRVVEDHLTRDGGTPLALIMIDLDRFKAVNDTLGHAVGDAVLRTVGQRLKTLLRETDFGARLGGDEFGVVVSPPLPVDGLRNLAARMIELLQRTYLAGGHVVNVGASLGIATAPGDGMVADRLRKSADLALYHSKASGKGTYHFFDPRMEERAQARRMLELELRKALPLRQFEVHYQPQIDIETGVLTGLKASLLWRHPRRGIIGAEEFGSLAEELGLGVQIGEWVLRVACREAAKWPEADTASVVASRHQFESGRLPESVEKALAAASIPGRRLEIEINENILLRNEARVLSTLHSLRALGVRIAMTNFGTGYASLTQLTSFPFDRITIDRSLTSIDSDNSKHRAIVRAIAALGASLGMSTMVEGVEGAQDLCRINSDRCNPLQGFLPSEPVPPDELATILSRFAAGPERPQ